MSKIKYVYKENEEVDSFLVEKFMSCVDDMKECSEELRKFGEEVFGLRSSAPLVMMFVFFCAGYLEFYLDICEE